MTPRNTLPQHAPAHTLSPTHKDAAAAGILARAEQRQSIASDPSQSAWVAASAGSGKTKVLVDRFLRLLMQGVAPTKILCLTYTRAAAAEMDSRLKKQVREWATLKDDDLHRALHALLGTEITPAHSIRARGLFQQLLDVPQGLRISTLHGFCQSLLRAFPLEAGLSPHFELIEEHDSRRLLQQAVQHVFSTRNTALSDDTRRTLLGTFADMTLEAVLDTLSRDDDKVRQARTATEIHTALNISPDLSLETLEHDMATPPNAPDFERAATLMASSKNGAAQDNGQKMAQWLRAVAAVRRATLDDWASVFLTKTGQPRARIVVQEILKQHPELETLLRGEAERLHHLSTQINAMRVARLSLALDDFLRGVLTHYDILKQQRQQLDYSDLIRHARALLQRRDIAPWILYKLDGGIDHVLLDEAQDTSPEQWQIIQALCEDFFAGQGTATSPKTLFVVGDVKQSIYRFQGADPENFSKMQDFFAARAAALQSHFTVPMNVSFRSAPQILNVVDAVFAAPDKTLSPSLRESLSHTALRTSAAGHVEVWPLLEAPDKDTLPRHEVPDWDLPTTYHEPATPLRQLAESIAKMIADGLATGRFAQAGDILILVQRRTDLVHHLSRALKHRHVAVEGLDRISLHDELVVEDMLALARFLLLPADDYALACVLKGPLFGIDEDDLFALSHERGAQSLWQRLQAAPALQLRAHAEVLNDLLRRATVETPYDLLTGAIMRHGGEQKIYARLGRAAREPLQEFLNSVLAFQMRNGTSLQNVVAFIESYNTDLKRETTATVGAAGVRIMTVHGAKGLEAPVVILPDTTSMPENTGKNRHQRVAFHMTPTGHPCLVWLPPKNGDVELTRTLKEKMAVEQRYEYGRLLYVAMTRAQNELYVAGVTPSNNSSAQHWYDMIRQAVTERATITTRDGRLIISSAGEPPLSRHASAPPAAEATDASLPTWLHTAPADAWTTAPRTLAVRDGHTAASLTRDERARGVWIHALLHRLPFVPESQRAAAARNYLQAMATHRTAEHDTIMDEVMRVLHHPDLAFLFAPTVAAEVPLAITANNGVTAFRRVDRVLVHGNQVLVADIKTDRRIPATATDIPDAYRQQLQEYGAALSHIYPQHTVRTALVWTSGARAMLLDGSPWDSYIYTG